MFAAFKKTKKNQNVLAIEHNAGSLRCALMRAHGSDELVETLVYKDMQGADAQAASALIKQVVADAKIKNINAVCVIPSNLVITKNVELPSQDPREIRDIVNLQAARHTPYGREGIVVDYVMLGVNRKNYTKILLLIVNRDEVRKVYDVVKRAGIDPERISFSSEAVACALTDYAGLSQEPLPIAVIHVDTTSTEFTVIHKKKAIFVRSIPIGIANASLERENHWARFVEEIKKSLDVYRSEDIESLPQRLIITGISEMTTELSQHVGDAVKLPVSVVDYTGYFSFAESAKPSSQAKLVSFFNVLAAAHAASDMHVNLIPEEARLKRSFEEKSRQIVKSAALLILLFITACVFFLSRIYIQSLYLAKLDKRFAAVHTQAESIVRDFDRVKLIRSYLSLRGYSVEILGEFYRVLPDEVRVSELRFDKSKNFSLKGTASSTGAIYAFVESLNKSPYFKEAKTRYTSKRKEGEENVTDFEIEATFNKKIDGND